MTTSTARSVINRIGKGQVSDDMMKKLRAACAVRFELLRAAYMDSSSAGRDVGRPRAEQDASKSPNHPSNMAASTEAGERMLARSPDERGKLDRLFATFGVDVDHAVKFAGEWRELSSAGLTRMSEEAYVATNMAKLALRRQQQR